MMNLGVGLGGLAGGLIATTDAPGTFTILFLVDAATFLVFLAALGFVPEPARAECGGAGAPGRYADVFRNRAFVAVLVLNFVFITAGMAQIESFSVYAKNEAAVSEAGIGLLWFLNTIVIVLAQLPIAKGLEGRRRMLTLALLGVVWAAAWALVPLGRALLGGAAAFAAFVLVFVVFGLGECLHGAVQAPLVVDLADPRLIGRYMALSALSWGVGFTLGPMLGGFALEAAPHALWLAAAGVCLLAGAAALVLERALPPTIRRTPRTPVIVALAAGEPRPAAGVAARPSS